MTKYESIPTDILTARLNELYDADIKDIKQEGSEGLADDDVMCDQMNEEEVDEWVNSEGVYDASDLLKLKLPKMVAKLNRLDAQIISVLKEVQEVFPDAEFYTGSGGFNLLLGRSHADGVVYAEPQQQRIAWQGHATISDGDW